MNCEKLPKVGETKLPELRDFMQDFAKAAFGTTCKPGTCWCCGQEVKPEDFHDELSLREYEISGMCQACQDKTWPGAPAAALLDCPG